MLTTPNDAIGTMLSRASTGALADPAPDASALEQIVAAGLRAPDHGRLRPWRFVAIGRDTRAAFVDMVLAAMRARDPTVTEAEADRTRGKLMAPPLILALGVHVTPAHKVPEVEQVMAVAAATMNMLNAAHALGFAGKWVTGPNSYDPAVATALGLPPPSVLAGFLHLGTPAEGIPDTRRPTVADHLSVWAP